MRLKIFSIIILGVFFLFPNLAQAALDYTSEVRLPVPQVWEIPDGFWVPPWSGACEEASVSMIENFYFGNNTPLTHAQMKTLMWPLFGYETKTFGYNLDTNGTEIAKLINNFSSFDATLKTNPTLDEIKAELAAGHPVISLHYGKDLKNPRHRYRAGASTYHTVVITGFDDLKKVFYVNDPELSDGLDYPYNYDTIMASLHDFSHVTKQADGLPTVLFTRSKLFVKASGTKRIYLVRGNTKYLIAQPKVLTNHHWKIKDLKTISRAELDQLKTGATFEK